MLLVMRYNGYEHHEVASSNLSVVQTSFLKSNSFKYPTAYLTFPFVIITGEINLIKNGPGTTQLNSRNTMNN